MPGFSPISRLSAVPYNGSTAGHVSFRNFEEGEFCEYSTVTHTEDDTETTSKMNIFVPKASRPAVPIIVLLHKDPQDEHIVFGTDQCPDGNLRSLSC